MIDESLKILKEKKNLKKKKKIKNIRQFGCFQYVVFLLSGFCESTFARVWATPARVAFCVLVVKSWGNSTLDADPRRSQA